MAKKVSQELDKKEYEKLGRLLVSIGEIGYKSKKDLYKAEFVKGIFRGLGSIIGATIVVAALLLILSALGEVPLIGDLADTVRETIKEPGQQ
jgi:hypothetical protein